MTACDTYVRRLRRLRWTILGLTALTLAGLEIYYYLRGVPLINNVIDWLIGMAIAIVIASIAFRVVLKMQKQLEAEIAERTRAEEALRASEAQYRTLVEQSVQGLAIVLDFRIVFANSAFAEVSGYAIEELLSLSSEQVKELIHPEDQALVWRRFQDRLEGKLVPAHYQYRGIRKNGSVGWLEMRTKKVEYRGTPAVQGTVVDITERELAEESLRKSEEKYRSLVESTEDSVYLVDRDATYLFMNHHYLSRLSCPLAEALGSPYGKFHSEEKIKEFVEKLSEVFETARSLRYEHRSERDGHYFLRTLSPVTDQSGKITPVTVISKDITKLKHVEEQLAHMATHDPLTGLPNRQAFNDRLNLELAHAQRNRQKLIVMMLDLDNFKDVSDTLGHKVGDQLLQAVAGRLKRLVRKSDTVSRLGGDEFMLIWPRIAQEEDAVHAAEKSWKRFESHLTLLPAHFESRPA